MKSIFLLLISFLIFGCNETVDTSQWKEDYKAMKPKKITPDDFVFFVQDMGTRYLEGIDPTTEVLNQIADTSEFVIEGVYYSEVPEDDFKGIASFLFESHDQVAKEKQEISYYKANGSDLYFYKTDSKNGAEKIKGVVRLTFSKEKVAFELGKIK